MIDPKPVLALIKPEDRILDVGGGSDVFPRANAVIDIQAYEQRKAGQLQGTPEQFTKNDWYVGDICAPDVWRNFRDKEFDFVICSHTLEDVRDPIFVCSQLIRVGKAGYIEVPSRFRECAKGHPSDLTAGWDHHRWIVDVDNDTLIFTFKNPWINFFDYLSYRRPILADQANWFTAIHWIRSFNYIEHNQKGAPIETEELFRFYKNYSHSGSQPFHTIRNAPFRGKTFQWVSEFKLPVQHELRDEQIAAKFDERVAALKSRSGSLLDRILLALRPNRDK